MNKVAVYTVITNGYDHLREPRIVNRNVDYICFTDDPKLTSSNWQIKHVKKSKSIPSNKWQREIKILAHKYLKEYDRTIYVDANIQINKDITQLLTKFRGGIMTIKHPTRDCIYKEGLAIIKAKKADKNKVNEQISEYYNREFEPVSGLYDTKMIIRDNRKDINELCEKWWEELSKYTHRDQLSFPIALKECGVKCNVISSQVFFSMVRVYPHKIQEPPVIHYISPFRSDKNIGKANNDEISKYDHNDWVCLTDADAMPLLPDYGTQIEEIIKQYGHEYGLIGCVTNRLGGLHQCWKGEFSEDMDMRNHYKIALEARETFGNTVEETSGVAGLCMIFSVELWKRIGGFVEKTDKADTMFNKSVKSKGLKIGLAKGLYFFHAYRIHQVGHKAAWGDTSHLK